MDLDNADPRALLAIRGFLVHHLQPYAEARDLLYEIYGSDLDVEEIQTLESKYVERFLRNDLSEIDAALQQIHSRAAVDTDAIPGEHPIEDEVD